MGGCAGLDHVTLCDLLVKEGVEALLARAEGVDLTHEREYHKSTAPEGPGTGRLSRRASVFDKPTQRRSALGGSASAIGAAIPSRGLRIAPRQVLPDTCGLENYFGRWRKALQKSHFSSLALTPSLPAIQHRQQEIEICRSSRAL